MQSVGVFEAKSRLAALLNEVESGGEVLITRRGKPVARLVAADRPFDREKAAWAAAGLREVSQGLTLGDLDLKSLTAEGRD